MIRYEATLYSYRVKENVSHTCLVCGWTYPITCSISTVSGAGIVPQARRTASRDGLFVPTIPVGPTITIVQEVRQLTLE